LRDNDAFSSELHLPLIFTVRFFLMFTMFFLKIKTRTL
jgi:hypothetical protein